MSAERERKRSMVASLVEMHLDIREKTGAELVISAGRFLGPKTIEVDLAAGSKRTFRGRSAVINTRSRATIDRIPGPVEANPQRERRQHGTGGGKRRRWPSHSHMRGFQPGRGR